MAIEAKHYEQVRQILMRDPIVQNMAQSLTRTPLDQIQHSDGTPRFDFMQAANDEYRKRGGRPRGHIGAVAEALLRIVKEEK